MKPVLFVGPEVVLLVNLVAVADPDHFVAAEAKALIYKCRAVVEAARAAPDGMIRISTRGS